MKIVEGLGISYRVSGEHEEEAAFELEQGLTGVTKRRSAYVDSEIDVIIEDIIKDYGVTVEVVAE